MSTCEEGGPPHVCGSYCQWVLVLKKVEEDVKVRKRALRDKLATAMTFNSQNG